MLTRRVPQGGLSWWGSGDHPLSQSLAAMNELRHEMDRWLSDLERSLDIPVGAAGGSLTAPRIDLVDEGSSLVVRADVPGFSEADLEAQVERGALTLRGRRTADAPEGYSTHRKERAALEFARTIALPVRIDAERVEASLRHGVLEIRLPKAGEDQPRRIDIAEA